MGLLRDSKHPKRVLFLKTDPQLPSLPSRNIKKDVAQCLKSVHKTETPHNTAENPPLFPKVQKQTGSADSYESHLAAGERISFRTHLPTSSVGELDSELFRRGRIAWEMSNKTLLQNPVTEPSPRAPAVATGPSWQEGEIPADEQRERLDPKKREDRET